MKSVRHCIIAVVSEMLGVPEVDVVTGSPWSQLPHPFDPVELVMAVGEIFGIELRDIDAERMNCLDDLIKTIRAAAW
jgi:acyl carrier protein